jgi:hypothetical protein
MKLVEIDEIGLETFEARFERAFDIIGIVILIGAVVRIEAHAEFAGDDRLAAAAFKRAPQTPLGFAMPIAIGRVEQIHAQIERRVNGAFGFRDIDIAPFVTAERLGPESDAGDFNVAVAEP